jgi:hypothetical protein
MRTRILFVYAISLAVVAGCGSTPPVVGARNVIVGFDWSLRTERKDQVTHVGFGGTTHREKVDVPVSLKKLCPRVCPGPGPGERSLTCYDVDFFDADAGFVPSASVLASKRYVVCPFAPL